MNAPDEPTGTRVNCGQCNKEIARAEAMTPEGRDYALFFCSFECYQQWDQHPDPPQETADLDRPRQKS
jgi:YHS domain-containing protein